MVHKMVIDLFDQGAISIEIERVYLVREQFYWKEFE